MAKTSSTAKTSTASAKAEEANKTTAKAESKATATKAAEKPAKEAAKTKTSKTAPKAADSAAKETTAKAAPKKVEKKTEKKTAEKKTTTTTKAASIKSSMVLQVLGKEISEKELVAQIKKAWTSQFKGKIKDIKTIDIYVKPEDNRAYFVINGTSDPAYFVEL